MGRWNPFGINNDEDDDRNYRNTQSSRVYKTCQPDINDPNKLICKSSIIEIDKDGNKTEKTFTEEESILNENDFFHQSNNFFDNNIFGHSNFHQNNFEDFQRMIFNLHPNRHQMNFKTSTQNKMNNNYQKKETQTEKKINIDKNENSNNNILRYNDNQIYEM